ncbi:MAG: putative toxin-antitoxin system toxin component, PIN family [bacterium]
MKLVLDSNVLIAAFATRGIFNSLFEFCLENHQIIISEFILNELHCALQKKIKLPLFSIKKIIKYLREFCILAEYNKITEDIFIDPDDLEILALAFHNQVKYIITGDRDLLIIKKFKNIAILSPRDFWAKQKKNN